MNAMPFADPMPRPSQPSRFDVIADMLPTLEGAPAVADALEILLCEVGDDALTSVDPELAVGLAYVVRLLRGGRVTRPPESMPPMRVR